MVNVYAYFIITNSILIQARNYVAQMPEYKKKPFKSVFTGANDQGMSKYLEM